MGGKNKGDINVGGKSAIERIADELDFFDELMISSEKNDKYKKYGNVIPDIYKNCGPMSGIYTAMKNCSADWLFVTACDMPLLKGKTVKRLCGKIDTNYDAVVVKNGDRIEPLFGIYSIGMADFFEKKIIAGKYAMTDALSELNVRYVKLSEITDDADEIFNMNTPRDYYKLTGNIMKIDLEKAVGLIEKNIINENKPERVSIWDSLGRTVAVDVVSMTNNPPFPRSPYDGYAVKAEDTPSSSPLKVVGASFAGEPADVAVAKGEAVRIMTGGVIPDGADCVVPQEATDIGESFVMINKSYKPYDNYIFRGEDFLKGDILIKKGTKINAALAALAAAGGNDSILVYPKIKAAVISTGDELTEVGKKPEPGKIYDTNLIYVSMRLKEIGGEVVFSDAVGDDAAEIERNIKLACSAADLVITTGGVSVGQRDLIPQVLEKADAEIIFHGVDIKPGMPTLFAKLDGKPILALSGNPFAAAVGFEALGRPLIAGLIENEAILPKKSEAVLANDFNKKSTARRFIKAVEKNGVVTIPESQGNGSVKTTAECNCYIDVLKGSEGLKAGDMAVIFHV
ncbi:MAG: NTP transferase domain-containing protein [Clostridiales bacterium]|nr:NTP transferase domain-containing protein [Clostridiales bacterium]